MFLDFGLLIAVFYLFMSGIEYPFWVWIFFFVVVFIALFVDIGIVNRKAHTPSRRETIVWSIIWISLAMLFNVFVFWKFGSFKAIEFFTGYILELSLSVDNLFVFLLIFGYFKVPGKFQHRVLFWGIFMALVLRMVMIFAGVELARQFHWILYVFGVFLIYTGVKMFGEEDENFHPEDSWVVRFTTRFIRISKKYEGEKFFTIDETGRRTGTLLLMVLIVINVVDIVFAVDSIPTILGITKDSFIIYTSNIFAILGLRTFFFLLKDMSEKFHYLKYGLAVILTFIGVKMLLPLFAEILVKLLGGESHSPFVGFLERFLNNDFQWEVIITSLLIIVGVLILSIILSLTYPSKEKAEKASNERRE